MKRGFFGSLFDLNRDGELNAGERVLDFMAFEEMCQEDDSDDDDDEMLELSGISRDELEFMDDDERREALEDAGFDPDDFDVI